MPTPHWQPFLAAAALIAFTPGANQLLSLRNAVQQGIVDALVAVAGRLSAFLLLVSATAVGLGELLVTSEPAFTAVKWCGVAYLLYLGGQLLYRSRSGVSDASGGPEPDASSLRRTRWQLTRQEFVVALTNPKALLLFAALLPQFVDDTAGAVPLQLVVLGMVYLAVEFVAATVYAGVGGTLNSFDMGARTRRLLDRGTGATMLAVAGGLAFTRQ
ncbi:LysE family translocator [Nocardia carnea]|uniref:LysE family translocator n=1 Tax=Nocardia carnea TaxID=37328 RepID=UPI002455CCAB|nr:LysE family translocator [Nocardia carnea]